MALWSLGVRMAAEALRVAREMACARDPHEMAAAAGAAVEDAAGVVTLTVAFLDRSIGLTWPDLELAADAPALPDHVLALVLYYLARSDGTPPAGRLISFAELPDGRFYVQAFRGYTGAVLAREFAERPERWSRPPSRSAGARRRAWPTAPGSSRRCRECR